MKYKVVAALAGGLVLGAAAFIPLGASAAPDTTSKVIASQDAKSANTASDNLQGSAESSDQTALAADITPVVSPDPAPVVTPAPLPTFSSDDEDSNDDDSQYGDDDSNESESDD